MTRAYTLRYKLLAVATCALASTQAAAATTHVATCQLGSVPASTVKVTKRHPIFDTDIYELHYAGKTTYFFTDEEGSRGGPAKVICAGKKQRALVAYGEFTANYKQGFVLVFNHATGKIERLDFAEKAPPAWLYLSEHEAEVVLPTDGAGENGTTPYVVYRYIKGRKKQPEPEGLETPKPPAGFEVIQLAR